jgi:hypothetical protein
LSHDEVSVVLEALEGMPNLLEVQNKTARLGDSLEKELEVEVEAVLQCLDRVMVDVCAMQQRVIACSIAFSFNVYKWQDQFCEMKKKKVFPNFVV